MAFSGRCTGAITIAFPSCGGAAETEWFRLIAFDSSYYNGPIHTSADQSQTSPRPMTLTPTTIIIHPNQNNNIKWNKTHTLTSPTPRRRLRLPGSLPIRLGDPWHLEEVVEEVGLVHSAQQQTASPYERYLLDSSMINGLNRSLLPCERRCSALACSCGLGKTLYWGRKGERAGQ